MDVEEVEFCHQYSQYSSFSEFIVKFSFNWLILTVSKFLNFILILHLIIFVV